MKNSQYILEDEEIKDIVLKMETKVFELEDLNPAEYNPRFIDDEALDGLQESLVTFGYVQPIIVNIREDRNVIVGGHQRYKVLRKKGILKAECVIVDVDIDMEKAMNVSLNNPEISGKWELNKLESLFSEMRHDLPNFEELQLGTLETNLELNLEEFDDFDNEDEDNDKDEDFKKEDLYTIEVEFLPEDFELFLDAIEGEVISYKTPSKKVQYGLKLAQFIKKHYETNSS